MPASSLMAQGGPVMYVLLGLSIAAAAIVLLKLFQFTSARLRRGTKDIDAALKAALAGDPEGARASLAALPNPVARVLETALAGVTDDSVSAQALDVEIGRVGSAEVRKLESWLRGLSAIAHLSPLLGLLGTVFGMISAFQRVEQAGARVDASVLSGGIWEALLTTAFGLVIAIPAMAAFYALESEVDRVRATMKDRSISLLVHFGKVPAVGAAMDEVAVARESYGV